MLSSPWANLLRKTAKLALDEIDQDEFARNIDLLFDMLAADYERQVDTSSN